MTALPRGQSTDAHIAVLGAGSIGTAFAIAFAKEGRRVILWDQFPEALPPARADLKRRLAALELNDMLHGSATEVEALVEMTPLLHEAVRGAELVQECVPENLRIKTDLFESLGGLVGATVPLASASSTIIPSHIAARLEPSLAAQVIVSHPGNPPYLLPVIELVPGNSTDKDIVERARVIYTSIGMRPVLVRNEVEGFIFNRLQGAMLREAYCLVRDDVATVADVDEVVRSGLGRRWSVTGPFETVDLNTRGGIASHGEKLGPAYERMGAERGQHDPWTPALIEKVEEQRRMIMPLEDWEERVLWRDVSLMALTPVWEAIQATGFGRETEKPGSGT